MSKTRATFGAISCALILTALSVPERAFAQYATTNLGNAGAFGTIYDFNNVRQFVGTTEGRAFSYNIGTGSLTYLSEAALPSCGANGWYCNSTPNTAVAINDLGEVTSWGFRGYSTAFYEPRSGAFFTSVDGERRYVSLGDWTIFSSLGMTEDGRAYGLGFADYPSGEVFQFMTGPHGEGLAYDFSRGYNTSPNWSDEVFNSLVSTVQQLPSWADLATLNGSSILADGVSFSRIVQANSANQLLAQATDGNLYVVAAAPEPSTYVLMLAGLAAVGFTVRRRKATETR